jgi:hypothetical protein
MHVLVDERRPENEYYSRWQVRFQTKAMPVGPHPRGGRCSDEPKLVLSISGPSLLALLHLVYMYASVDTWTILPILLVVNVLALQWTMEELGWTSGV